MIGSEFFENLSSDGGYWIFMTSQMGQSWSLVGVGSYVEIWPRTLRVQAHWQLAKFGDETAVCKAGARPHPLIGWKPSSLSTPGGNKEQGSSDNRLGAPVSWFIKLSQIDDPWSRKN